jgi:hypothetical protein
MSEERTLPLGKLGTAVATFVLWAFTAVLGMFEILVIRDMVLRVYARFFADDRAYGTDYWGGVALGQVVVVILAIVWIGLVIGAAEYHYKYYGQRRSWRLFARVIGVELAILVLALFI